MTIHGCVRVSRLLGCGVLTALLNLACFDVRPALGQGLLVNPSFESPVLAPGTFAGFFPGQAIGSGWQVASGSTSAVVVLHDAYAGGGAVWPQGSQGDQYLFLGDSYGMFSIYQDVPLQAGNVYRLDYAMATLGAPQGPYNGAANLNIGFRRVDSGLTAASQNSFIPFDASSGQFHSRGFEFQCPASGVYRLFMDNVAPGYLTCLDDFNLRVIPANLPRVRTVPVAGVPAQNAQALSRDGSTAVGWDTIIVNPGRSDWGAFVSLGEHAEHIGHLGGSQAFAYAVNANGSVVVGESANLSDVYQAFRWTPVSGMQSLGTLGGRSHAYGVSDDGNVVAGYAVVGPDYHAYRWTPQTGMQDIGSLAGGGQHNTVAYGVSGDGRVITGSSTLPGAANVHAFRWTSETGMLDIGGLGGFTYGFAANQDGSAITGFGFLPGNQHPFHAFRWTAGGGMQDLGTLSGLSTVPNAISSDGGVIVGTATNVDTGVQTPFVWTPDTGIVSLPTFLASRGLFPEPDWVFRSATGISGDGLMILGNGLYNGEQRPYLVKFLPANPWVAHPQSQYLSGRPTGPVTFAVQASQSLGPVQYRWFVLNAGTSGEWSPINADGIGPDGLVYSGAATATLEVRDGPIGWRRGRYRCDISTAYGDFTGQEAAFQFPLVTVLGGSMQCSATIELLRYGAPPEPPQRINFAANSANQAIPPSTTSFNISAGGQTGGGFIPGAPTILASTAFSCSASALVESDTTTLRMNTDVAYFGCGVSYVCIPDDPAYCSVACTPVVIAGGMNYRNNATGEEGSIALEFGYHQVVLTEAPLCRADFNHDANLDPDDLGDFITCYFMVPPCAGADYNRDADVNPDDLGDFITAYFTGCP